MIKILLVCHGRRKQDSSCPRLSAVVGQIGANPAIAYYRMTTDDLISIKYCKRAMIDSENCPVTAHFCAVYAREMTCYIPAAERTYTYPKTTVTRRYEHSLPFAHHTPQKASSPLVEGSFFGSG